MIPDIMPLMIHAKAIAHRNPASVPRSANIGSSRVPSTIPMKTPEIMTVKPIAFNILDICNPRKRNSIIPYFIRNVCFHHFDPGSLHHHDTDNQMRWGVPNIFEDNLFDTFVPRPAV